MSVSDLVRFKTTMNVCLLLVLLSAKKTKLSVQLNNNFHLLILRVARADVSIKMSPRLSQKQRERDPDRGKRSICFVAQEGVCF